MGPDLDEAAAIPEADGEEVLPFLVLLEGLDGADAPVDPAAPGSLLSIMIWAPSLKASSVAVG